MERLREDPEPPVDSKLSAMPESVPIDWFDPEAWNSFTVRERVEYTAGGISVGLPLEKHCDTLAKCAEWKNLPEEEFMEKYGNDVLAQYQMPTEAEIDQLAEYEAGEEEEEEEEEEGVVGAGNAGEDAGETSEEVPMDL
jgi:hypothetical protein